MSDNGTPLQQIREIRGLSQAEVADAVGVDQSTYCRIEKSGGCTRTNAEKLAKYFGSVLTELHIMFPERYTDFVIRPRD